MTWSFRLIYLSFAMVFQSRYTVTNNPVSWMKVQSLSTTCNFVYGDLETTVMTKRVLRRKNRSSIDRDVYQGALQFFLFSLVSFEVASWPQRGSSVAQGSLLAG